MTDTWIGFAGIVGLSVCTGLAAIAIEGIIHLVRRGR